MVAVHVPPAPEPNDEGEQRVLFHGVSYDDYLAIRRHIDAPGVRLTYYKGALEIMTPSDKHEVTKSHIGRFFELYALERDIPISLYGSTTFRRRKKERALEPDECYFIGERTRKFPDIAIEVVIRSGGLAKLPVYEGLGVREVWFWEKNAFHLHALRKDGYESIARSELVPDLDFDLLARFVRREDHHAAIREFRDWLRTGR
jgi:Uma2 family endonuclease